MASKESLRSNKESASAPDDQAAGDRDLQRKFKMRPIRKKAIADSAAQPVNKGYSKKRHNKSAKHDFRKDYRTTAKPKLKIAPVELPRSEAGNYNDVNLWKSSLERASKRVSALNSEVQNLGRSVQIRTGEISTLKSIVSRLTDENQHLNRRLAEILRDHEALQVDANAQARQARWLVSSNNRLHNDFFWSICHFVAGSSDFQAYAKSVDYDLTRLFCMLLTAEIAESGDLSQEIKTHASIISNIFDPFFYLSEYQDVALRGLNPLVHYVTSGHQTNHRPTPLFDTAYYAKKARLSSGDPLLHYVTTGARSGLKPHPLFDTRYYVEQYPDVTKHRLNPLFHYQTWGGRERRNPSPVFDTEFFLESRDLYTALDNPLREYLMSASHGSIDPHPLFLSQYFCEQTRLTGSGEAPLVVYEKQADRQASPHPLFDLHHLRRQHDFDFRDGESALETFIRLSRDQDIDPTPLFDSSLYRYQVEVERGRTLTDPPIIDYLKRGYKDSTLLPNILFDPQTYRTSNNIDFAGPELTHYRLVGDRAGYLTHPLFSSEFYNAARTDDLSSATALEHFFTTPANERHQSHPHTGRPLVPEMLEFAKLICVDDRECDPAFYGQIYMDLVQLSEAEAATHFQEHGKNEGRVGSPRGLAKQYNLRIRDLPLGFFPDEYIHLNPDLTAAGMRPEVLPAFAHYVQFGRAENRTIGRWQFYLDSLDLKSPTPSAPLLLNADAERVDVCVLTHIFYPDLWPELAAFARNFESVSRDIFVNVVDIAWTPQFHRQIRELCPGAFVQLSNDNGRDIGGFVRLLDNIDIKKYDLFAFMHSKKSPHIAIEKANYWRRCLLAAFAGTPDIVAECVQSFREDPSIGLIGAKEWRATEIGKNQSGFDRMLDLFSIDERHRTVEYLSGTMFLIRSEVVQRIYDVLKDTDWEYGGDKDVVFHMDGQSAHAVERVIGSLIRQMGYRMVWR